MSYFWEETIKFFVEFWDEIWFWLTYQGGFVWITLALMAISPVLIILFGNKKEEENVKKQRLGRC